MNYEKSCGGIVYRIQNGNIYVLLVQMNRGHWSFPKGHMKSDENEVLASLREIKEETHLDVDIQEGFKQSVRYISGPDTEKEVIYFLAKPKSNIIQRQETEIMQISWLKFDDAIERLTYDKDKEILKNALLEMSK
jgi:bis(5'-nucleosidyl)-tetraphosphatase